MLAECSDLTSLELCEILVPQNDIPTIPLNTNLPTIPPETDFLTIPSNNIDPPLSSFPLTSVVDVMSHSVKDVYENETLPNTEEFFDENQEIKFQALEKKFTIEDGDFKDCPSTHIKQLKSLLNKFKDRFSTFKLDVEVTDMYTADLETEPGK